VLPVFVFVIVDWLASLVENEERESERCGLQVWRLMLHKGSWCQV